VVQGGGIVAVGGLSTETGDVGVTQQRGEHGTGRGGVAVALKLQRFAFLGVAAQVGQSG
jgi:hypothetical protein